MDPFWNFLHSLPNRCYLNFVGRFIQMQDESSLDPFAIDLPDELADDTYVPRKHITEEVRRPDTRLILGKAGSGKSTIFASLLRQPDESTLSVGLNLHQVSATLPEPDIQAGEASLLTLGLLVPRIFETYWENTIRSPQRRVKYLSQLRVDKQWMELLRWFCRRYPLTHPDIDDYELMSWLRTPSQAEPLGSQISPLATLRELMRLITWKAPPQLFFGFREFSQAYTEVEILLDGTEQLSPAAIRRLVTDAQSLYDMHLDKFQFELFMDSAWQSQVADMDCVRQGCVSVVNLPPWSDSELRELLRRRILSSQSGGSTIDPEEMPEYDLGDLLADSGSLSPEARERLESLIIGGAQGIPLHALRLARCVVAACARCWPQEFVPPLGAYDIERLVDLYQNSAGLSGNNKDLASEQLEKD
jgi:hypothetical protein